MPDLGPLGRGGARRRTRRRMTAINEMQNAENEQESNQMEEIPQTDDDKKLEKLARLLRDKGVITESEYTLIFE